MRSDRQHTEYHLNLLGLPVYYGAALEGSGWWRDMLTAFALVMRDHDPELMKKRVGAGTGAVHLTRLALKWLPEPYASEVQTKYLILQAKRRAIEEIDAQAAAQPTT